MYFYKYIYIPNYFSIFFINLAGTPPTTVLGSTSFVTTAPAAIVIPLLHILLQPAFCHALDLIREV